MEFIAWVVFGFLFGLLGKAFLPERERAGLIPAAMLGVIGGFLGGWLGEILGIYAPGAAMGLAFSVIGAAVMLLGYGIFLSRRARRRAEHQARRHDRAA